MNRSKLAASIKLRLNRPNLEDAAISEFIETTEGELNRLLRDHPRNRWRALWPSLGVSEAVWDRIPIPEDLSSLITLRIDDGAPLEQYPVTITPAVGYHDLGVEYQVFPALGVGQRAKVDYVAFLPPLVASTDTNWVSAHFADIYLYGCLKEAAQWLKDDERFQTWQAEYARRVGELQLQGWNQNIAAAPRMKSV